MNDYLYNGFNDPQPEDRITAHLNQVASSQQPQVDPQQEFLQALGNYQSQYGVSQGQSPQMANISAYDQQKQAAATGDPRATAALKFADNNLGQDEATKSSFFDYVHQMPQNVDPTNSYQMYNAFARFSKDSGYNRQQLSPQMPTAGDISLQDKANILNGKGSNYAGIEQQAQNNAIQNQLREAETAKKQAEASGQVASGGSGGATLQVFHMLEQQYPNADKMTLLRIAQNKVGTNLTVDPNTGAVSDLSGAATGLGNLKAGEKTGELTAELGLKPQVEGAVKSAEQNAIINSSAEIERQKKIGAGEITDVQKKQIGQNQVSTITSAMRQKYNDLKAAGAAVSTENTPEQNLSASTRQSAVGQFVGKRLGTKEQSIRNQISMQLPNLINSIRSATGMSAKAMDSNTELQFYLKMASDPSVDIESNLSALDTIEKQYGIAASGAPNQIPTIEETKSIGGKNYHKVNGQWMEE